MNILSVRDLTMSFGALKLYEEVSFGLAGGERVALVGPNGAGKSTLLKILAGELSPDGGEVVVRDGVRVGLLAQSLKFEAATTAREVVARAVRPLREAIEAFEKLSARLGEEMAPDALEVLLGEQEELQERIERMGGWSWENRVEEMLHRLGVEAFIDEPIQRLSGGQRRRVGLARVLLESPDLLLLDEPTNHLDTEAVEWLEGWLHERGGALLFITHDRYFMEKVADRILEIDDDGFYDYPGDFETFMERRTHRLEIRKRTEKRRQKHVEKELKWLNDGMKSQANRARWRVDEIEAMQASGPVYEERKAEIEIGEPPEFGDRVLEALGVWKKYQGKSLFEGAHFSLRPGDRIGLIGPNGSGKTTLLRMLAGLEKPDAGKILSHDKTEIAYLDQGSTLLDRDVTAIEALGGTYYVWINGRKFHKRDYLNRYLFDERLQETPVRLLSGGQVRRLGIAKVLIGEANVLIFDEPTNDLDMITLTVLEDALASFEGAVIVVSHDRYFLNRVCTAIVAVEDKHLERYEGNYDDYRKKRAEIAAAGGDVGSSGVEAGKVAGAGERARKVEKGGGTKKAAENPAPKGLSYMERRRLGELEEEIAAAEARQKEIEAALSDPKLYQERADEVGALNQALKGAKEEVASLWEEWEELEALR